MEGKRGGGLSPDHRALIAITPETAVENEAGKIAALLRGGFYRVHLRHPEASAEELRLILEELSPDHRTRVVLHSHFELAADFTLGGLHLNHSHPTPPADYHGPLSRSCHTLEEIISANRSLNYVTLSPIFDSISKSGYRSVFGNHDTLAATLASAPIPVIALGGISPERLHELSRCPFSGYAMLGAIPWNGTPKEIELFANKTVKLLHFK